LTSWRFLWKGWNGEPWLVQVANGCFAAKKTLS